MKNILNTVVMGLVMATTPVVAQQTTPASSGITIIGDQELPQVLYIVPWKNSTMPLVDAPRSSLMRQQLQIPCQLKDIASKATEKTRITWPCNIPTSAINK